MEKKTHFVFYRCEFKYKDTIGNYSNIFETSVVEMKDIVINAKENISGFLRVSKNKISIDVLNVVVS